MGDEDAPMNGYWVVDPVTWLYVAGTTPVIAFCIVTIALIAACWLYCVKKPEDGSNGGCAKGIRGCANCCTCCTTVLYFTWAVIGFSIYYQEMTDDCIDDEMGDMLYGWSVVYLLMFSVMLVVVSIGFCVFPYCVGSQSDSNSGHAPLAEASD